MSERLPKYAGRAGSMMLASDYAYRPNTSGTYAVNLVEAVHVQLAHKTRILKGSSVSVRRSSGDITYVVVLKVRAQNRPAKLAAVRYNEARDEA